MKTAEQILKLKLDPKVAIINNPDYTFNKVIEAMEEYANQYRFSDGSIKNSHDKNVAYEEVFAQGADEKEFNELMELRKNQAMMPALGLEDKTESWEEIRQKYYQNCNDEQRMFHFYDWVKENYLPPIPVKK